MPRREGRSGGSGGWPSLLFFSPDNLVSSKPCTNYVGISYWILFCHFILHVSKVLCLVWVSLARLEGDVSPLSRIVIVWIAPVLMGPFFVCGGFSLYPSGAFLFAFQYDPVVLRVFVWYMCPFKQTNKKKEEFYALSTWCNPSPAVTTKLSELSLRIHLKDENAPY